MRRFTRLVAFVTTCCLLLVAITLSQARGGVAAAEPAQPECRKLSRQDIRALDGRTLFEGIFFSAGPAAALSHRDKGRSCVDASASQPAERQDLIDKAIAKAGPDFLDSFAADIKSGDPARVGRAMERGLSSIKSALAETAAADCGCEFTPYFYYYIYYYIAVVLVAILYYYINTYVYYYYYQYYYFSSASPQAGTLEFDQWVADVAAA